MRKLFISTLLGYIGYIVTFHYIFLPQKLYEILFILVSSIALIGSYYFYQKDKKMNGIVCLIILALSFSIMYMIHAIFAMKYYTSGVLQIAIIFSISICLLLIYFYYYMKQFFIEEKNKQIYIRQIEKEIYESYIHTLRHDYNQKLYKIKNSILMNDQSQAIDLLNQLTKESYSKHNVTISNQSSLNHMFQLQISKYELEEVPFHYYICKINQNHWKEEYDLFLYQILESIRMIGNDVTLYIQSKNDCYVCRVITIKEIDYSIHIKDIEISKKDMKDYHVYTITLPFSR